MPPTPPPDGSPRSADAVNAEIRALWSHPSRPDGLLVRARHDPDCRCVAIFSRARRFVRAVPQGGLLNAARRPMLGATLRRYGFSLSGSGTGAI